MSEARPGSPPRSLAASFFAFAASLALLAPPPLYLWQQGLFDAPRVKLTRLITGNDRTALAVARAIERGHSPEAIEAETGVSLEDGGSRSVTLAWYLLDAFGWDYPRAAYFDWKDGCEQVCPQFDAMLAHHGISERPDRESILADEARHTEEWSAMPVVWAHYAPVFDAHGLQLLTLDPQPGWDAYYIFVAPKRTARSWDGTVIDEPGDGGLDLRAIPVPTSDVTTPDGLAAALAQVTGGTPEMRHAPLLAGLPFTELF